MKSRLLLPTLALGLLIPAVARAHHGRDFLIVQDYYLPGLSDGVLLTSFEYSRTGTDYEFGIEPEILIGVLPRVAVGVSVGFTDQTGMSWAYESVMPSVHIQLSPPDSDFPIRFAVSAGYEFAREHDGHTHGTVTTSSSSPSTSGKSASTSSSRRSSSSSSTSSRRSASGSSSNGGGGIVRAVTSMLGGAGDQAVASAPAPTSSPMVAAAPADYGTASTTTDPATTPTNGGSPDFNPDAPPDGGSTGTGGTGGGSGDGHNHNHGGSGHNHGSGSASHSHTNDAGHDHGNDADHSHDGGDHAHGEGETGHDHGNGKKGHHDHQGTIHVHGQDAFIGRFIMETDLSDEAKLVVNLINVLPDDGTAAWGYAAGIRQNLTHSLSLSLEAMGDFSADGYHEINLGAIAVPNHHLSVRVGAGIGLTEASPDWSLRGGVVWRF